MFVVFFISEVFSDSQRKHQDFLKSLFLTIDMISVERRIFAFYIFCKFATAQTTTQLTGQPNAFKRPQTRGFCFTNLWVWCWNVEKKTQSIISTQTYNRQSNIRRRLQRAFCGECVSERWLHIIVRGNYSLKAFFSSLFLFRNRESKHS